MKGKWMCLHQREPVKKSRTINGVYQLITYVQSTAILLKDQIRYTNDGLYADFA